MIRILGLIFVAVFFLLVSALALGQGGVATGDLHVTVKDPKGNLVANAVVRVRDAGKGLERSGSGDGQGGYSVRLLPPGVYSVTIDAPGFNGILSTGVGITVGGLIELPVTLSVATGKEVVEVTSQADLIETSRSSTTDTIGQRRIDNLPINGRNYINFTLTDSQVVRDNAPNTGAAPTSGLNMSGQRARSNLVNVDGADATDNSVNGVRSTVSQEAVQEFQIISNSYAAEYGRAAGGVVNIITRSGSNDFHGDVFGYLRNRNFQAVNPFSTVPNPAYTRVQGGTAFGGPIKKDKTYFYFSYEITRRHETGFSSIGQGNFGLVPFDTATTAGGAVPLPFGTIQATPGEAAYLQSLSPADVGTIGLTNLEHYELLVGASSGQAIQGTWPTALVQGATGGLLSSWSGFPTTCTPPGPCVPVPASYQTLASQVGNYPVFEGTSVYSLRIDHNVSSNNRLMLRSNVSPSTITGIEVGGQDQPFGQNAYSRTSQQTFRDVAGTAQDTWTIGNNKVNEFRFQYARRGLAYFYNTHTPQGSDPAVNIPGFAYFGREPYSYIQRTEQRYQFTNNFSWTMGRHDTKFGVDFNYIPINAIFTVNYGGVVDIGSLSASDLGLGFGPGLSPVQAYGAGIPADVIQGLGSPSDSFHNLAVGAFWQDSWRVNPRLTVNYGLRYDIEKPPTLKPINSPLAQAAYNLLNLQKGIQTATHNFQPRIGMALDPGGNGKTVIRASYGIFYDHPLLGLYFLGDASDGSSSGQLAFGPGSPCQGAGSPGNLNAVEIFQGLVPSASGAGNPACSPTAGPTSAAVLGLLNYSPNQQLFSCTTSGANCGVASTSQSIFLNQNYLNPTSFLPLAFQPFGYPQAKNFVYAYAQQANLTIERDLGGGFALSLAYNFNGGRHLNRPINANTIRGDLMTANFEAALADGQTFTSPFTVVGECNPAGGPFGPKPFVDASLMNFFRPGGLNPSIIGAYASVGDPLGCIAQAAAMVQSLPGFNANCNPATFAGCVPFGDMDANYSNGSSIYHGFSANLRKRFKRHYEFLASYTWSHSIDDSTDLQSTLTPQDSYFPAEERSTSLFDQRNRLVFSGVYQSERLSGNGFASKFFSNWTVAPLIEIASGRPFNVITGNDDNLQLSSLTGRPNTTVNPICTAAGFTPVASKFSPTGMFQEPCLQQFIVSGIAPSLQQLDGNLGRNAGISPWNVFNDLRVARRIYFGERYNLELIADMFNIANKDNVSAVSPLFTNAGQATSAYDPRQFQFAMKMNW
ncbi:MAG TPA: TonB-dependent receptor [Bryobacteraceae bacterium]|nr:TonB-dependent receptor [Bryobacteraceae bacterium]